MVMKYDIMFLPRADRNLIDINEYLSRFYPSTAAKFFEELDRKISLLREMPHIGQRYIHNEKYRRLLVYDYLVLYVVDESRQMIEIHRIFHGSQDIRQWMEK